MSKGNTKAALRTLSKECRGTVLNLNDIVLSSDGTRATVLDILKSKHPPSGGPPDPDTLIDAAFNPLVVHPVIFDSIQGQTIRSAPVGPLVHLALTLGDGGDCALPLSQLRLPSVNLSLCSPGSYAQYSSTRMALPH